MEHSWGDCNAPHMYKFPGKSKSLVWILTKNCFTKYGQGLGCEYCGETSGCVGLNILHPAAECPLMQSALEAPFRHPKLLAPSPLWVLDLHFCHDNLTSHIKINVQRKFGLFVWKKNLPEGNKLAKLRRCIAMVPIHHNPTIPHILAWLPTWGWGNSRSKYAAYARAVSSEPHLFRHQHRGALPSLLDADMPCYATAINRLLRGI